MKKMLAALLALVLALSCTAAMAETADAADAPAFEGVTIESEYDVDRDALNNLLSLMGLDEATLAIADTIASVIDQAGEKLVIANEGAQFDLLLKGTSLVNLVALVDESSMTLGSNLVPHYALKISFDEISEMVLNMIQTQASGLEGLDLEGLQQAVGAYMGDFVDALTGAVSLGEAQQGEFVLDGVSYNVLQPLKVDLAAINDAANDLVSKLQNDEAVQSALSQLAQAGVDVSLDEAAQTADSAALPDVDAEIYMNLDENGNENGPTQVNVNVTPAGETDPATVVITKVDGDSVTVDAQFISVNTSAILAIDRNADDPFGTNCRLDVYVEDFYTGFATVTGTADQSIVFDSYVYVMDTENPIAEEHGAITMSGALTEGVADDATVLTLADLTGEDADSTIGGLGMDLLLSGLGSVISTATQLMPEEINAIASLAMGGGDAEEPAA